MKHPNRNRNGCNGKPRKLRLETLEQRRMLDAAALGCELVPLLPETAQAACAEICQLNITHKESLASLDASAVDRVWSAGQGLTPVDAIRLPQTIETPSFGEFPDPSDMLPEEQKVPLPEGVDMSKIHGPGCPDKAPPSEGNRWWMTPGTDEEWAAQNRAWDVSCSPMNPFWLSAEYKRQHWGGARGNPLIRDCRMFSTIKGGGDDKDDGATDAPVKDTETDSDFKDKPVDDNPDGKPPLKKDPEPEGDDPDELLFPAAQGAAMSDSEQVLPSPTGQIEPGEDDPWERHRREIAPEEVDPEDGGPDELGNPAALGALGSAGRLGGQDAYPTPDDDGNGPPPPPTAGYNYGEATDSTAIDGSLLHTGHTSYTDPDHPDGPPRPEI